MSQYGQRTEAELALYAVLEGLVPSWETKKIGVGYTPKANISWQSGKIIKFDRGLQHFGKSVSTYINGLYQVNLYYPAKEMKQAPLTERAQAVQDAYFPNREKTSFTNGNTVVIVSTLPDIGPVFEDTPHIWLSVTVGFMVHDRKR